MTWLDFWSGDFLRVRLMRLVVGLECKWKSLSVEVESFARTYQNSRIQLLLMKRTIPDDSKLHLRMQPFTWRLGVNRESANAPQACHNWGAVEDSWWQGESKLDIRDDSSVTSCGAFSVFDPWCEVNCSNKLGQTYDIHISSNIWMSELYSRRLVAKVISMLHCRKHGTTGQLDESVVKWPVDNDIGHYLLTQLACSISEVLQL